ncbi:MAG: MurR/RpiR family transcriptional regulator [Ruminococcaceae bacterium]|nr:MurR/RpiR family transcriptional regulator [Oscillospiraceae bacterium]
MNTNLLNKIEEEYTSLSKGQKRIADYILKNYDKASFMTASKLGKLVGVSESTVVRFAAELGYDGYPQLQKALQEIIRVRLTAVQRLEVASNRVDEENILQTVLTSDMEKIKVTLEQIDRSAFQKTVETILSAKHIYILGVRSSAALASFLGFYFNLMFQNVRLVHTSSVSEMFEQILNLEQGDVVIGISFPRYSKRTIQALQYAKDSGATVISLTDSNHSPLVSLSDIALTARSDMVSFADSLVAPLSLINALIVAISMQKKDEVTRNFEKLEEIWEEYHVYEKPAEE